MLHSAIEKTLSTSRSLPPHSGACRLKGEARNLDRGLETVIRHAVANARAVGRDCQGQAEEAVRTVCLIRPDLTVSEALSLIESVDNGTGEMTINANYQNSNVPLPRELGAGGSPVK